MKLILGHLRAKGWVEYQPHKWFASTKLMDYGEKGRIHSNIPDDKSYRVIDIDSGKEIGIIAGVFDEAFALAGKVWRVVSVYNDTVKVRRLSGRAESALFNRRRNVGAFYYLLPPKLRDDIYL